MLPRPGCCRWLGEAPARTAELSIEVGRLRASVEEPLATGDAAGARRVVEEFCGVGPEVSDQAAG